MFVLQMHISSGSWEADLVHLHYNEKNAGQQKLLFRAAGLLAFLKKINQSIRVLVDGNNIIVKDKVLRAVESVAG